MLLSKEQKELIVQTLQTQVKKTQWVVDNKDIEEKKKDSLSNKIRQMKEIIAILEANEIKE